MISNIIYPNSDSGLIIDQLNITIKMTTSIF